MAIVTIPISGDYYHHTLTCIHTLACTHTHTHALHTLRCTPHTHARSHSHTHTHSCTHTHSWHTLNTLNTAMEYFHSNVQRCAHGHIHCFQPSLARTLLTICNKFSVISTAKSDICLGFGPFLVTIESLRKLDCQKCRNMIIVRGFDYVK